MLGSKAGTRGELGVRPFGKERPLAVALFIFVLAAWQVAVSGLHVPAYILPAPSAVVMALIAGIGSGVLILHTWITLEEVLVGFVLGSLVGIAFGILISRFPLLQRTLYPYVVAFQTVPKVALAPLLVIWFGLGIESKIVITALIAFFPVLVNVLAGLDAADAEQVEVLRSLTASEWQVFSMLRIPASLPFIFAGLDVAGVFSVIGAIVGEFVGAQGGLGYLIQLNNFNLNVAGTFGALLILALLGLGLHLLVRWVEGKVVFWREHEREHVLAS